MTDHLNDEARAQLESLGTRDRCTAIMEQRWIGYPAAQRALEAMTRVRDRPRSTRTAGVAICGPFLNGKTMVSDRFLSLETLQIRPSYYYVVPTKPTRLEFLSGMIQAMGRLPDPSQRTIEGRRQQLHELLDEHRPRIFVFDDAHHGFTGSATKELHSLLRLMGHRWDLSPVLIGNFSLRTAIHGDGELKTRLANCPLERWEYNQDFGRLLQSLERALPLARKSELTDEVLAARIYEMAEGLIGDIVQNVALTAVAAVRSGEERVTAELFDAMNFEPPSRRFAHNPDLGEPG